tara:strand:- start:271 stop:1368 length:1098 start_codon:yes stop_codon:yes gene_type:complete
MSDYNSSDKSDSNANNSKTTSSGNKENNQQKITGKVLSYPLQRDNTADTDYLEIQIAEYKPPGLKLPAFENDVAIDDDGKKILDAKGNDIPIRRLKTKAETGKEKEETFALARGSDVNNFRLKKKIKNIINLPMPRNVTDTQGVLYGEGSLNPLEAFGLAATTSAVNSNLTNIDSLKQSFAKIADTGGNFAKNPDNQQAIAAAISGTAVGALGGNVSANQLVARASGQILNPNLELLFNGVGLRTFPMSFIFFARNRREGQVVLQIIRTFKKEMAPRRTAEGGAGVFIKQPSVFQLTYKQGREQHPFLNRFLPTVLSDMKVNYAASGAYSSFYDGTPTHIQVDMQFKELNPIFQEDYEGVGGVGY